MTIAVWIVSGIAAALYLMAGGRKLALAKDKLPEVFTFVEVTGVRGLRLIGLAEVLGAIGLILPVLTGIAPILTPIAGFALALIMVLAIILHVRRKEHGTLGFNALLLVLPLFVAIVRLLGY